MYRTDHPYPVQLHKVYKAVQYRTVSYMNMNMNRVQ
jgi:hypothetical protein